MQIADPNLYSAEAVREMDRMAIESLPVTGLELMRRAAQAAFARLNEHFSEARRITVLCGAGNNAGDGYALARLLLEADCEVDLIALTPPSQLRDDAATCARAFLAHPKANLRSTFDVAMSCELIVDALLGTGLSRDITGDYRQAIDAVNQHPAPVLSLDIPTGIESDSGRVLGTACRAQVTVSFIAWKAGLFLGDGRDFAGMPILEKLGVDASIQASQSPLLRISTLKPPFGLSARPADSHKGSFGHAVLVGGNLGMPGAIRLAAEASLNAGAGVVSVITRPEHAVHLATAVPELMCIGVSDGAQAAKLLERAAVIAVGPGLGRDAWAESMFRAVSKCSQPVVADADALALLREASLVRPDWVLTPHPGEAGRLLACKNAQVQADRLQAARQIHETYGSSVVLKGRGTIIFSAGKAHLALGGTPAMAAPGMGDVLCGIIAGLMAQGLSGPAAALSGVQVHNYAAELAANGRTRGLRASSVIKVLPECVN